MYEHGYLHHVLRSGPYGVLPTGQFRLSHGTIETEIFPQSLVIAGNDIIGISMNNVELVSDNPTKIQCPFSHLPMTGSLESPTPE